MHYYIKDPIFDGGNFVDNKICCCDGNPTASIYIPSGERCPLIERIPMDFQSTHELANDDGKFTLVKWGMRYCCDESYHNEFEDFWYHISQKKYATIGGYYSIIESNQDECTSNIEDLSLGVDTTFGDIN